MKHRLPFVFPSLNPEKDDITKLLYLKLLSGKVVGNLFAYPTVNGLKMGSK